MRRPVQGELPRLLTALLLVPGLVLLAACGSNNNKKAAAVSAPAGTVATLAASSGSTTAAQAVEIKNIAFPDTVSVKPGTTVTWTNKDSFPHTVTADAGQSETFDSKPIAAGGTFSVTFAKAGTFSYHCNIHSTMHGKIVVGDQATGASTPVVAPTKAVDPGYKY